MYNTFFVMNIQSYAYIIVLKGKQKMSFASYFKLVRKEKQLTQNQMAEAVHVCNSAIRNIETGRTTLPQYELFFNLAEYLGLSKEEVAHNALFSSEDQYNRSVDPLITHYLSYCFSKRCVISPAPTVLDAEGNKILPEGVFWKAGYPHYKVLLSRISKNKYFAAIKSENKTEKLAKLIFSETLPYDKISETEYIKEVRFVLDKKSKDEAMIYKELNHISVSNLGNSFCISYELFDPEKEHYNIEPEKCYITKRKTSMDI